MSSRAQHTRNTIRTGLLLTTALVIMPLGQAMAQTQLPQNLQESAQGAASAGRVQGQIQSQETIPSVSTSVEVRDIILQDMPKGAEKLCFAFNSLEINGNSAYDQQELRPLYGEKLGTEICLDDLYRIATRLTQKYRNDGYILTQVYVPPQTIENGVAKLNVLEGYLESVSVEAGENVKESEMSFIQAYANGIKTGGALNAKELERYLLLINDLPGLSARSVLGAAQSTTGAATLRIIVERDLYDGFLSINNHGSRYLGAIQGIAALSANSFFGKNERITAQFAAAPFGGELFYGFMGYEMPINHYGTKVDFSFSHSSTAPGYNLEEFDVKGRAQGFTARITHPFARSREQNLYGYAMLDWRDVTSKNNLLEPTRDDRIRAFRGGINYEFLDTFWKVGVNSISLEVSQGLNVFGATEEGDLNISRSFGDPQFTKLNAEFQRLQGLTQGLNLLVKARGQLSNGPLLSSEEFGVGGPDSGRAYDPSEIIGDEGIAGTMELQWNTPYQSSFAQDYQLFSFIDAGRVWNDDATTSSTKSDTATSVGLGVRAEFKNDTKAGLSVAFPLNRDVATQGDGDPRVYFSLSRSF
jgi:hemolysin activation/secretion protein